MGRAKRCSSGKSTWTLRHWAWKLAKRSVMSWNRVRTAVTDQLAAPLARDGDPEPIHLEETDTRFAIGWKGHYHIDGPAFIYTDRDSGRVTTILGYPTQKIAQAG
jgi:hypothetical protein